MPERDRVILESAQDWRCRRCDYNLRGADIEGSCPECGESVSASMQSRPQPSWGAISRAATVILVLFIFFVALTASADPCQVQAAPLICNPLSPTYFGYPIGESSPLLFGAALITGAAGFAGIIANRRK